MNSKKTLLILGFLFVSIFLLAKVNVAQAGCAWVEIVSNPYTDMTKSACNGGPTSAMTNCKDTQQPAGTGNTSYGCCCGDNFGKLTPMVEEKGPIFSMPDFQVQIPGLKKLATINCPKEGECSIPWIGQYISGVYNYALAIVGILAAIILMGGGLMWLVSGGDVSRVTQAKELIIGSITGLIILISSYLILLQVNPNLVNLSSVAVTSIKQITIYPDADIDVVGGARAYADGCAAARKGDLTICAAYGERQPEGLINLEKVKVNSSVAQKYTDAMECVKKKNGKYLFFINEAWRSAAKQIDYKKRYPTKSATPCCSNHGAGQAMDINRLDGQSSSWSFNDSSGLKNCMNAQGLYANLSTEPWHWSPTGR